VQSLGLINCDVHKLLANLGRRISCMSGDDRKTTFCFYFFVLFLLLRFNSVFLHNSFELDDNGALPSTFLLFNFFLTYFREGLKIIIIK